MRSRALPAILAAAAASAATGAFADGGPEIRGVEAIVTGPSPLDGFRRPAALAVAPDRDVFVVGDTGKHRLVMFDGSGRCRGSVPLGAGGRDAPAAEPLSLAFDARGRLYVVDAIDPVLSVMTPRGSLVAKLTVPPEIASGRGVRPRGVATDDTGRIWLLHSGDEGGLYSEMPGGRARQVHDVRSGVKSFVAPVAIALSPDGSRLALLDPAADAQVQVRTRDGALLAAFGRHGEGEGTLSLAAHVVWGPGDTLWVTDTLRHTIIVFDAHGSQLGRLGGVGRAPGQFLYPAACGFLDGDRLVVLERGGERCQILEVSLSEPRTTTTLSRAPIRTTPSLPSS